MSSKVVFNLNKLKQNIDGIKLNTKNINFLFPVKCCNNKKVLELIINEMFGFDISNMTEYNIIKKYLKNQFVSVSGPLSYELDDIKYHNIHIVSNSLNSYKKGKGLRVNFNSSGNFEISHFGISYDNLDESLKKEISYIHFHISDYKNKEKCKLIYNEIKNIVKIFPNLSILNVGGHLEDLSFDDGILYLNKVREIVPKNIQLFVEIGDFLFKGVGILYSKVIDVRRENDIQTVILDFSKMANQRWAYPKYSQDKNNCYYKTIFFGCSCCETDVYMECLAKQFRVGDTISFENISPYSYQWNTTFNGINKMKFEFVYKNDGEFKK